MTLHFFHHVHTTPKVLMDDAEAFPASSCDQLNLFVESREGQVRMHALYVVLKLSELLKLTKDDELEDLLVQRILRVLEGFKPVYALQECTTELLRKMHGVFFILGEKVSALMGQLAKTPERAYRLDQWVGLIKEVARVVQAGPEA